MTSKREEYILQKIDKDGKVKVHDLSEQLSCSEVTIRNDIQRLENHGLVKRIHGGAMRVKEQIKVSLEPGNVFKYTEQKQKIAKKAFEYIADQDTVIFDDSSVNYYLANCIKDDSSKRLVVITTSLIVSAVLSACEHVTLFMVGGQMTGFNSGKLPSAIGEVAVESLSKFHADKAFISAHGINFEAGVTAVESTQMQVKQAILSVANEINVLVDSGKFGGGYIMVVCPFERVTRIITDDGVTDEIRKAAKDQNISLIVV